MKTDVTTAYFLPESEKENLIKLCKLLTKESGTKVSLAAASRFAIEYFEAHPTEINALPRSMYKKAEASVEKIPLQMPPVMLEKLEDWKESHSVNSISQVIRQALINFAAYKGFKWEIAKRPEIPINPEWKNIKINGTTAAYLAGVSRTVINRHANNEYYSYEEEESYGARRKRLYQLAEIVQFYNIPREEVDKLLRQGESEYCLTRKKEIRGPIY